MQASCINMAPKRYNDMPIYVLANWKMNLSYEKAMSLVEYISSMPETLSGVVKVVLFPSAPYLFPVSGVIEGHPYIKTGVQNIYWERSGSYTGEVSIDMLPANCEYVLVGHSERRANFNDTEPNINRKIATIIQSGKKAVLCISEEELNGNPNRFYDEMVNKISSAVAGISGISSNNLMLAYEPVWAIGSGIAAEVSMVKERNSIISHILEEISGIDQSPMNPYMVFYGGSVDHTNAASYVIEGNVNGLLVGSASLKAQDFKGVISALIN